MALRLLRDKLEIYRDHGASWALWTYEDIGLHGLVHARPGSPYLQLVDDLVEKKGRLGIDSWGGSDAGVRDVIDPIHALFERTTPHGRGAGSRTLRCSCATSCSPSRWPRSSRPASVG